MREYSPMDGTKVHEHFKEAESFYTEKIMEIWLASNQEAASRIAQKAIRELEEKRQDLIRKGNERFNPLYIAVDHMLCEAVARKG